VFPNWKTFAVALGAFASTCPVEAQSPALSVTFASPDVLQFSWPGNFTNWQLMTTTNLAPATWQTVPLPPFASNSTLTVLLPVTESKRYFRLQETGAGSCVFHATPPVINSGQHALAVSARQLHVSHFVRAEARAWRCEW